MSMERAATLKIIDFGQLSAAKSRYHRHDNVVHLPRRMPDDNELQQDLEQLLDKLSKGDPDRQIQLSARVIQALCDLHSGEALRRQRRATWRLVLSVIGAVALTALVMRVATICGACIGGALF